jgi:putative alpha-1,2-mannosidase
MSLSKGFTQGGSNADNVLGDAYLKGISEDINWDDGYDAVVQDAEVEPYDWCCEGRGGLDSWKALGYIPVQDFDYKGHGTMTRSISRTLEYSYNDYVISQIGSGLGGEKEMLRSIRPGVGIGRTCSKPTKHPPSTPRVLSSRASFNLDT